MNFDLLRKMRRHTIVESCIMQACKILVKAMMDKESENHIEEVGLSNNNITCRVPDVTSQNDCYPSRWISKQNKCISVSGMRAI